jgi:hypothetical protein
MHMRHTFLFLTLLLTICSCEQKEQLNTDKDLEQKIKKSVTEGNKVLDLGTVADFDWDSLLIITPYANFDDIEKDLSIDLERTEHVNIESRDDINLLIFYAGGEPLRMVEYPRYPGDFANNKIEFVTRDNAKFDITVTIAKETGADWITLPLCPKPKARF